MSLFLLLLIGAVLVCTVLVFVIFKYKQKLKEYEAHINTLSSAVVSQSKFLSLGEIVGNITHQWKQPLNAIATIQNNMKVAILYGKGISDEKLVNSFEVTFELVEHLSSTIDTFYSFLVKHNSDVRFDIHTAIENVRKITEYTFINSNIKIKLEMQKNIEILGDKNEFIQVVINLIFNAKEALEVAGVENPEISICVYESAQGNIIEVRDNAGGINEDILESIFSPQVTTKNKGSGLGLYMSKNIVEKSFQGKLLAKNIENGACFVIELPQNSQIDITYIEPTEYKGTLERMRELSENTANLQLIEKALAQWEDSFKQAHWAIAMHSGLSNFFTTTNPAFEAMYGYNSTELTKMTIGDLTDESKSHEARIFQQLALRQGFASYETIHIKKDGSIFPVSIDITAVKNDKDSVLFYVEHIRDLSEIKAANERLLLKKFALDKISEAIFLIDKNSKFHYVNDGACKALGYTKEELLTMGVVDIDPNCSNGWWGTHWDDIKKQKSITGQSSHRRKDGSVFPIEVSSNYFEYNGVEYSLAISRDITERLALEREKANRIIKTISENSPDIIIRYDLNAKRTYTNPKAKQLSDIAIGKSPMESTPIIDKERYISHLQRVIQTGVEATFEITYKNSGSKKDYSHVRMVAERDDHGNIASVLMIGRDITEIKILQQELQREERFLADAQRVAQVGSWYLDIQNNILHWSDETYRIFELDKESVTDLHKTFYECVHPDDREKVNAPYVESIEKHLSYEVEHRIVMADGSIKYVVERCEHIYDEEDKPTYSIGTVHDITGRKIMENELRRKEAEFRTLVENSTDYIARYNKNSEKIYANPQLEKFLQITGMDLANKTYTYDVFTDESYRRYMSTVQSVIATGVEQTIEVEFVNVDGIIARHHINMIAEKDYDGEIKGALAIGRDITYYHKEITTNADNTNN